MRVLHETYGYTPCFPITSQGEALGSLLPLMDVRSVLTGHRGVSLPFSDFCDALCSPGHGAELLVEAAIHHAREKSWQHVDFRMGFGIPESVPRTVHYFTHELDLRKGEDSIWFGLDGAARRSIRKARNARVVTSIGHDEAAMREFFKLHCLTRKRHGVPPQPYAFFANVWRHLVNQGDATIMLASHHGRTIAAKIFMHFGNVVIFKFGASDLAFQHLRPNNLLMWEAISRYVAAGKHVLHMGRNEIDNAGLRRYKLTWGTNENQLFYHRYSSTHGDFISGRNPQQGWQHATFRRLPVPVMKVIGSLIYPHMA